MSGLESIRREFAYAVVRRCTEQGCTLKLAGLSDYVVLKGEKLHQDRKMPDCIIFEMNGKVVVGIVELKSRTVHVNDVVEKLENGCRSALKILQVRLKRSTKPTLLLLVLCKAIHSSEFRLLTSRRIKAGERRLMIQVKDCGFAFASLLGR